MEMSDKDKFGSEWQFNHHQQINPASVGNPVSSSSPHCPSVSMVDSFCSDFDQSKNHPLLESSWNQGIVSHFLIDSGYIERAARFSALTPLNFTDMLNNPFTANVSNGPVCDQRDNRGSTNDSGEAHVSGDFCQEEATNSSPKPNGAHKRKRTNQDDQVEGNSTQFVDAKKDNLDSKKKGEKKAKDGSDEQKDYIHVRARRGQATNSHSLAERVRREKISQRMKFLQELVPGCSKVTGKAVMLDEIINYVQSLQRQVEFLSMKLASVNPRSDINIEGFASKDLLHLRGGSSSGIGFSSEMIQSHLNLSQLDLVQAGIPSMANSSEAMKRAISSQLNFMKGYKDIAHQMPNAWEDDIHNVMQMNFGSSAPLNTQEQIGKPHEGFPL